MIQISDHVIKRYRQRCNSTRSGKNIKKKLIDMWEKAIPAELKKEYRAFQLAKHGADKITEYRIRGDFILVSVDGILMTMHSNESRRWKPASFLETERLKERIFKIALRLSKCNLQNNDLLKKSVLNELQLEIELYEKELKNEDQM